MESGECLRPEQREFHLQNNYKSSEYTLTLLVVFFCLAVMLMAGAGWVDLDRIGAAIPIVTAGATALGYAVSRAKVKAKREENVPYAAPPPMQDRELITMPKQKEDEY